MSGRATASPRPKVRWTRGGPDLAQAVSATAQAGLTVSGSDGMPCGKTAGPRLKRASGPFQESLAWKAKPERWSGIRTRDPMINSHLLYPTELSSA